MTSPALRSLLTAFWGLWLAIVAASNTANALRTLGVLPRGFPFASGNLQLIETTLAAYSPPPAVVWLLFAGVIAWQAVASALLWRVAARLRHGDARGVEVAYAAAMGLFAAFMVTDELLIAYALQGTHLACFTALAVTFLVVREPPAVAGAPAS
jgi:hypothetical protein